MADDLAKRANEAFVDEDFDRAVELYTEAIRSDPKNANLFVNRSQAHIKLENFTDALVDANTAIELDSSMSKAYLRKGVACYSLEEYHTAKAAFEAGHNLDANNATFKSWIQKCDTRLLEEAATDRNKRQADSSLPSSGAAAAAPLDSSDVVAPTMREQQQAAGPVQMDFVSNLETEPSSSTKPKYRHEFYQKPNEVVVSIFVKGLSIENVKIEFGEQFLSVIIEVPGEDRYVFQKRLFAKIISEQCRYSIFSTKIEIRLVKAHPIHWASFEYEKQQGVQQKFIMPSDTRSRRPPYPSSNTKAPKDWDMLEAQVKKEENEEKLEGDAALNKLFRDIYRDADEDTRRAMSKSFVESNGTVLSTNWKEVGSKRVEGSPPQGMVMKKWEI